MERHRNGAFARALLVVLGMGGLFALGLGALVHEEMHVGVGGEILHDDFGFRVRSVESET